MTDGSGFGIGTAAMPTVISCYPRVAKRSPDRSLARPPCLQMPQWHPRVAKGASIGTLGRGSSTEAFLVQGRVAKERKSVPLTGLWSGSRPGLARHPRLQVVLRHPRVAKRASIGTSARAPCPQMPQWHPRVAKRASIGTLARRPCLQASQWHPHVAKRSSDQSSARSPCPQMPQWHPRGVTVSWCIG